MASTSGNKGRRRGGKKAVTTTGRAASSKGHSRATVTPGKRRAKTPSPRKGAGSRGATRSVRRRQTTGLGDDQRGDVLSAVVDDGSDALEAEIERLRGQLQHRQSARRQDLLRERDRLTRELAMLDDGVRGQTSVASHARAS